MCTGDPTSACADDPSTPECSAHDPVPKQGRAAARVKCRPRILYTSKTQHNIHNTLHVIVNKKTYMGTQILLAIVSGAGVYTCRL